MEKRSGNLINTVIRVVLTGPECTGKSTMTQQLAEHFHGIAVPEYARDYVGHLNRPYDYDDVLHIANVQRDRLKGISNENSAIAFFDTYLIITKIWFKLVYGHYPDWIDRELRGNRVDLYLLCNTDIPWIPDPVRENGGEMREKLFVLYKNELDNLGCNYSVISGIGSDRISSAITVVNSFLSK